MASAAFIGAETSEAYKVINNSDVVNIVGCEPVGLKKFNLFLHTKYEGANCIIAAKSHMNIDSITRWFLDRPLKQNDNICLLDSKRPKTESTVTAVYTEYSNVFNTSQTKVIYNHHPRHHRNHSFSHCPNSTIRKYRVVKRLKQKLQERRKSKEIAEVEVNSVEGCDTQDSILGVELDNEHQQENNLNVGNDVGKDVLNDNDHSKRNKDKNSVTKENQPTFSIPRVHNETKLSCNGTAFASRSTNSTDSHIKRRFQGSQNKNQGFEKFPSRRNTSVGAENDHRWDKDHDMIKRKQKKPFRDKIEVLFEVEHDSLGCCKIQKEDGKDVEYSRLNQLLRDLTNLPSSEIRRQTTLVVYPAKKSKGSGKSGNRRGNRAGTSRGSDGSDGTPGLPIQVTDTSPESLRRPPRELVVTSTQPVVGSFTASTLPIPTIGTIAQEQDLISRIRGERRTSGQDRPVVPARYPDYMNQPARQQSFGNWPSTTGQDRSRMAVYGFFYTGQVDLIRCFQCGIGLKDWGPGDEPLFEHIRHSPQCPFLRDLLGNDLLNAYKENLHMNGNQPGANAPNSSNRMRNPLYETLQSRLDSFSNWPSTARQTPQSLAEAGLFYTGFNDLCRCYHCDGGLQRWEGEDVPWVEHARWFPHCNYVKQVKGQAFINMVRRAAEEADREDADPAVFPNKIRERRLQNQTNLTARDTTTLGNFSEYDAAAQGAVELGFSRIAVQQAIDAYNRRDNSQEYTTEDLVNILTARMDSGEILPTDNEGAAVDPDPQEENRRLKGMVKCMICEINDTNMLFLPCTHHRLCESCAERVTHCPVCNQKIEDKVKTFMS